MNRLKRLFSKNNLKRLTLFLLKFYRRFHSEKIMKEASNLTFVTVLGFVPFLLFIVFLLPQIQTLHVESLIQKYIVNTFLPDSADLIIKSVNDLLQLTVQMNIFNLIILLITSYSLFASITGSFDKILRVEIKEDKSIVSYLVKFFGTIITGFFIMLLLFSISSLPFISFLFNNPTISFLVTKFVPFFIWFILIFYIYTFLPSKRLNIKNIAISSVYVAIMWLLLKNGFDWYITNMTKMKVFYGVISSFPIFLFWIYANWIIVLSGIVLLSLMSKNRKHRKISVKRITQISVEDEQILYLQDDFEISKSKSGDLAKWIKDNLK